MSDWNAAIEAAAKYHEDRMRECEAIARVNPGTPFGDDCAIHASDHKIAADEIRSLKRPSEQEGGWVLVPREPTEEMIDASCAAWVKLHPAFPGEKPEPVAGDIVTAAYRAMLTAAPSPEKAEGER